MNKTKLQIAIETLEDIKKFGYINSGCGYSCAKKAEQALEEIENAPEILSVEQQIEDINDFQKELMNNAQKRNEFIKDVNEFITRIEENNSSKQKK